MNNQNLLKHVYKTENITKNHWIRQRISAILLLSLFAVAMAYITLVTQFGQIDYLTYDVYNCVNIIFIVGVIIAYKSKVLQSIALLSALMAFLHLKEGIENIIQDYVHNEKTKLLSFYFISCIIIESFKYFYLYLEIFPLI